MKHVDTKFSDRAIRLDGDEFHNCVFQTCTLEIGGAADVALRGCDFIDCQWVFVAAAATTVAIMAKLYAGMVTEGPALIEQTFDAIRQGSGYGQPFKAPA